MALYFCVRIRARCGAIPRLGRGQSPASNLQKFPYHLKKAEGGAGEAAKKLKGNFGVAFAFQSSKSSSQSPFKK